MMTDVLVAIIAVLVGVVLGSVYALWYYYEEIKRLRKFNRKLLEMKKHAGE